jgi:hypothetical protein
VWAQQRALLPVSAVELTAELGEQRRRQRVRYQSPKVCSP